jgi:hypothetical protein
MNRRFQDSPLYSDFRDLAVIVLFTDILIGIAFFALWKFTASLLHR